MTIIDEIRAEFQKRFEICQSVSEDDRNALDVLDFYRGKYTAYSEAISFINMLLQEQEKEQHSEDLEEAVEKHINEALYKWSYDDEDGIEQYVHDAFKAGAEWQKENIISLIQSRLSEIIGDAQPKPALRAEVQELIEKIKKDDRR